MLPASLNRRVQHLQVRLEHLACDLEGMWTTALEQGDFRTIDRLVEAGHALQRAILALEDDSLVPTRSATALDLRSAPIFSPPHTIEELAP